MKRIAHKRHNGAYISAAGLQFVRGVLSLHNLLNAYFNIFFGTDKQVLE